MKISLVKVLLGIVTLVMTLEVQATRYAADAVKIDFVSIGAGRNEIAYSAINHILDLADSNGQLDTVNEVQVGFEGYTKMCASFNDYKAFDSYSMAIARVAVLSEKKWKNTLYEPVRGDCNDDQTKGETYGQLGPFATNDKPSLVCKTITLRNNPDNYEASLEIFEGYENKSADINIKFKQSSSRIKYKMIEWEVDDAGVSSLGDIEYTSAERGDLVLVPTVTSEGLEYTVEYKKLHYECK